MIEKKGKRRTKSWKGCTACRAARRKCTEEQPQCAYCQRSGLNCKYDVNVRFRIEEFVTKEDQSILQRTKRLDAICPPDPEKPISNRGQDDLNATTSPVTFPPLNSRLRILQPASHIPKERDDQTRSEALMTIKRQPIWTDLQIDSVDSKYFHFFLNNIESAFLYSELFPNAISEIFIRTIENKALRHAVLSISSLFIDQHLHRPITRALTHKQEAFAALQDRLAARQIDEELAIAIFLILFMDVFSGKHIAQTHLRGLFLVLKELHVDGDDNVPLYWPNVSPLIMYIWRLTIRMDILVAVTQDTTPVFPALPAKYNDLHKSWAMTLAKDGRSADWAVASFALDTIYQRAALWAHQAGSMSASDKYFENPETRDLYETLYRQQIVQLRQELADWINQPALNWALQLELIAQQGDTARLSIPTFLHHPPLVIYDRSFTVLLNIWRALNLYISSIAMPTPLCRHTRTDVARAIEYCRTLAALALTPDDKQFAAGFFGLLTVGSTFSGGKRFQNELRWCSDRITEMLSLNNPFLAKIQHFVDRAKGFRQVVEWDDFDDEDWEMDIPAVI